MAKREKINELKSLLRPVTPRFLTVRSVAGEIFCRIPSQHEASIVVNSKQTAIAINELIINLEK